MKMTRYITEPARVEPRTWNVGEGGPKATLRNRTALIEAQYGAAPRGGEWFVAPGMSRRDRREWERALGAPVTRRPPPSSPAAVRRRQRRALRRAVIGGLFARLHRAWAARPRKQMVYLGLTPQGLKLYDYRWVRPHR